jgi:hypothetical protein
MPIDITLAADVTLTVSDTVADQIRAQLEGTSRAPQPVDPSGVTLGPDDLMWRYASGGDRHAKQEFGPGAEGEARRTRRELSPKAKLIFEELLTHPGHLFTTGHFIKKFPDDFKSPSAVAGAMNGFTRHCERADRSFPFYWWEGRDGKDSVPTRYAIHPDVAQVFLRVGA